MSPLHQEDLQILSKDQLVDLFLQKETKVEKFLKFFSDSIENVGSVLLVGLAYSLFSNLWVALLLGSTALPAWDALLKYLLKK